MNGGKDRAEGAVDAIGRRDQLAPAGLVEGQSQASPAGRLLQHRIVGREQEPVVAGR